MTTEHLGKHKALLENFEQMVELLNQLTVGKYNSLELYINNCHHFRARILEVQELLVDESFEQYLMKNDVALYCGIYSMSMAIAMLANMLENLKNFAS